MAVSADVKRVIRRLANAILDYAKTRGWDREDVQLYYRWVPDWDRLHILVVIPDFEGGTEFQAWSSILTHLGEEFADDPEFMKHHLSLLVRTSQQVQEGGIYEIGPEYREYEYSRKK